MTDEDEPPQYVRQHRAKRRMLTTGRMDGGAIAVGVLLAMFAFAITVVLPVSEEAGLALVAIGLFVGGWATGRLVAAGTISAILHGLVATVLFLAIAAVVGFAEFLADPAEPELAVLETVGTGSVITAALVIGAFVIVSTGILLGRNG